MNTASVCCHITRFDYSPHQFSATHPIWHFPTVTGLSTACKFSTSTPSVSSVPLTDSLHLPDIHRKRNGDILPPMECKILRHLHRRYCDLIHAFFTKPFTDFSRLVRLKVRAKFNFVLPRPGYHAFNIAPGYFGMSTTRMGWSIYRGIHWLIRKEFSSRLG